MGRAPLLYLNVFVIATCGLVYELLAATLASYVLGDSVTQFSLIIGIYLSAMGVGSWLSAYLDKDLALRFLDVELGVALVGGLSAPLLFLGFARLDWFPVLLYGKVFLIGALVGLELPLLMRILREQVEFKYLVARVLSFDYLGALLASLVFPLFFVPRLGLVRTSLVFGLVNAAVALWGSYLLAPLVGRRVIGVRVRCAVVAVILVAGLIKADRLTTLSEDELFADEIVHAETTPYQRIVVTRGRAGFNLFLNGNLQFASADEYRYHEALTHPAMALAAETGVPRRVLILGGGDGLALREVLKWPGVETVTLVDLDPSMTRLAKNYPPLRALNGGALEDPRVTVVNEDAMVWIARGPERYDVALLDFPDPNSFALGKLYTRSFYQRLAKRLAPGGAIAVQATSPLFARRSFWCVVRTMEAAGLFVRPYHVAVPSFGVWGFALARHTPFVPPAAPPQALALRFLNADAMAALFALPADLGPVEVEVNRLDNQALVRAYEAEWQKWQ
ncbi:MAG: polyamine aminopropyltransferase [Myxococcales bacterium]|nr:polyamine aminopropyltransferase [Myxococcales bacterium]